MRKVLILLFAALPLFADEARKRELAAELLRVSHLEAVERTLVDLMFRNLRAAATSKEAKDELRLLAENVPERDTREMWIDAFARLEEKELLELIAFYNTRAGQRSLYMLQHAMHQSMEQRFVTPEQLEQARADAAWKRTMADMRSLATALEARATDTNAYPSEGDLAAIAPLISPVYIKTVPMRDGWGHEFAYVGSPDGSHYTIVSAGADGVFEPNSRRVVDESAETRYMDRLEDDIIFADGTFVQAPKKSRQ